MPLADDMEEHACVAGRVDPAREDAYWRVAHRLERYFDPCYDYEDYAPAYCVGYVGHAQYGGTYEDAEKSLCANWERIRGDSRLSLPQALMAMRAAWDRMAWQEEDEADEAVPGWAFGTPLHGPAPQPAAAFA